MITYGDLLKMDIEDILIRCPVCKTVFRDSLLARNPYWLEWFKEKRGLYVICSNIDCKHSKQHKGFYAHLKDIVLDNGAKSFWYDLVICERYSAKCDIDKACLHNKPHESSERYCCNTGYCCSKIHPRNMTRCVKYVEKSKKGFWYLDERDFDLNKVDKYRFKCPKCETIFIDRAWLENKTWFRSLLAKSSFMLAFCPKCIKNVHVCLDDLIFPSEKGFWYKQIIDYSNLQQYKIKCKRCIKLFDLDNYPSGLKKMEKGMTIHVHCTHCSECHNIKLKDIIFPSGRGFWYSEVICEKTKCTLYKHCYHRIPHLKREYCKLDECYHLKGKKVKCIPLSEKSFWYSLKTKTVICRKPNLNLATCKKCSHRVQHRAFVHKSAQSLCQIIPCSTLRQICIDMEKGKKGFWYTTWKTSKKYLCTAFKRENESCSRCKHGILHHPRDHSFNCPSHTRTICYTRGYERRCRPLNRKEVKQYAKDEKTVGRPTKGFWYTLQRIYVCSASQGKYECIYVDNCIHARPHEECDNKKETEKGVLPDKQCCCIDITGQKSFWYSHYKATKLYRCYYCNKKTIGYHKQIKYLRCSYCHRVIDKTLAEEKARNIKSFWY